MGGKVKDYRQVVPALDRPEPRCVVLGAGKSGLAAVRVLQPIGARVALVDSGAITNPPACTIFERSVTLPEGDFDLCVTSPSIPLGHPFIEECRKRSIPIISEMELGYAFWQGRILAVTGSKGKSSIVKLCAETLSAAGMRAVPCGNYGTPLCDVALDAPDAPWAVAETSSFQLEHVVRYKPDAAILLNIQADHLDRHGTMEEYAAAKFRIFAGQDASCAAFIPSAIDAHGSPLPRNVQVSTFGSDEGATWRYVSGTIRGIAKGTQRTIEIAGTWFDNEILGPGAAAAAGALAFAGLDDDGIGRGFAAYTPLPHRMERVANAGGITFIDDSKATSLAAVAAALRMAPGPVRLIAGGRLKEDNTDFIKPFLSKSTRKVYLIGECESRLFASWRDAAPCAICHNLSDAVKLAASEAGDGDCVMLSPGCASFDQFAGYGQRGEVFSAIAKSIAKGKTDDLEEQ